MKSHGTLTYLVDELGQPSNEKRDVDSAHLWRSIRSAIDPPKLASNLAEALRISATETEQLLIDKGFGDLVALLDRCEEAHAETATDGQFTIPATSEPSPFCHLFSVKASPAFGTPIEVSSSESSKLSLLVKSVAETIDSDAFQRLYREDVSGCFQRFMAEDAPRIRSFVEEKFAAAGPKYIVNSGIGANEQFNHMLSQINNANPERQTTWLIVHSPRQLWKLPQDATIDNTLFMEFSRSGKTEETVKLHEFTPREANRIVFANSGPLRELGLRDQNLVLSLPDQVSGRFGRNKTPILLAPMVVANMDVQRFWERIADSIEHFRLGSLDSLPAQIAQFIFVHQRKNQVNHIYLGANDDILRASGSEFVQFWNEGVNKNDNDILMSAYFGLLRDSHANIEGILANAQNKLGIFLLFDHSGRSALPPLATRTIDPINRAHAGLTFGDDEVMLAEANYQRFAELLPCIKIMVDGPVNEEHAAVLGQLWADVTFFYSKLMNIDPGSNPEVKHVRDRAADLLTAGAASRRTN